MVSVNGHKQKLVEALITEPGAVETVTLYFMVVKRHIAYGGFSSNPVFITTLPCSNSFPVLRQQFGRVLMEINCSFLFLMGLILALHAAL